MSLFSRRPSAPRDRQSFPQPGYVTVVSAEAQDWEFIPAKAIARSGHPPVLSAESERWLSQADATDLLAELTDLANANVSADDRLVIRRAAALVNYGVETGTGIQVVPPA